MIIITHEEHQQEQESFNRLLRIVNDYKFAINVASFNSNIIAGLTSYPEFIENFNNAVKARKDFFAHPFTTAWDVPSDFEDQAYELWLEELPPDTVPF